MIPRHDDDMSHVRIRGLLGLKSWLQKHYFRIMKTCKSLNSLPRTRGRTSHQFEDSGQLTPVFDKTEADLISIVLFFKIYFLVLGPVYMEVGDPTQIGEVTCGGYPNYHVHVIKLKWEIIWTGGVTPPTWGPPPPCKQALRSSTNCSTPCSEVEWLVPLHIWNIP